MDDDLQVKPLKWVEARCSDRWERYTAESLLGAYEVLEWSNGGFGGTLARGGEFSAESIEAAKAIAQSDYETRVRSVLDL